ncbi:pyrroloquinoline quinone biosynthesis peptide chaperone PqqD [Streptomyces sp. NPDC057623]|uniref:pyrroloquinoline quinone biosynthesis peptide chaperone PqqD n=1 Tax=Streptomyces sp. NPDC057623 TaxID=3346187 RepID=UPI0036A41CB6
MSAPAVPGTDWRPRLSPAIVRRHDPVRDADLLLLPERVGVLTGSAAAVVGLCDGTRRVDDIVEVLTDAFPGAPVAAEVPPFLARLREEGWLR